MRPNSSCRQPTFQKPFRHTQVTRALRDQREWSKLWTRSGKTSKLAATRYGRVSNRAASSYPALPARFWGPLG